MLFSVHSLLFGASSTCLSLLFCKCDDSLWKVLQSNVSDLANNCAFYVTLYFNC